jgi:aminopeptidase-like protein
VDISDLMRTIDPSKVGHEMYELMRKLYPICRSITGNGFRDTLRVIQKYIPLKAHEVASGTDVFDWKVPKEWNITDAYVKNSKGERVIDFRESNLHVMSYSVPVHASMSIAELKEHLHTLPDHPDWIPYRTLYYKEDWGFCLTHNKFSELTDDIYEVFIDASLEEGSLTYGEYYLKGTSSEEVLISCHACHPSLCNDNLSGIALATILGKQLASVELSYSYRFLFVPGTIGSITWLSMNEAKISKIRHGLVLAGVGDPGEVTYKKSRLGNAEIDRAAQHVLRYWGDPYEVIDFIPYGYDERQYCSPGFNLPVGCFQRTPHGQYPEYHTSADNFEFVKPEYLSDSFSKLLAILNILENNKRFLNTNPKCEPQLGKRGLYGAIGGQSNTFLNQMAMLWVLNLSDGQHSLLDISQRSRIKFDLVKSAADALLQHDLLKECLE